MPDVKPALTERDMREAKNEMCDAVHAQRVAVGVPVPDSAATEKFVEPILRQIECEHEDERRKALAPVHKQEKAPADQRGQAGGWYAEPDHSPRMTDIPGTKGEFFHQPLGTVEWHLGTNQVKPLDFDLPRGPRLSRGAKLAMERFQLLMGLPEWRDRIVSVLYSPMDKREREKAFRGILADSVRAFGSPTKQKERKIVVHGK